MDIVIIEIDLGKKLLQLGGYGRVKAVTPRAAHGESRVDDGLRCANSWRSQSGLYLPLPLRCRSKSPGTWSQVQCVDLGP